MEGKKKRVIGKKRIICAVGIILLFGVCAYSATSWNCLEKYSAKTELLKNAYKNEPVVTSIEEDTPKQVVFLSLQAEDSKARVFAGSGMEFETAWANADKAAQKYVTRHRVKVESIKSDVVQTSEFVSSQTLQQTIKNGDAGNFHVGLSFDKDYTVSLLENELNGAELINYTDGSLLWQRIESYLKDRADNIPNSVPNELLMFTCKSYFCDENDEIHRLSGEGYSCGRREQSQITAKEAELMTKSATQYLVQNIDAEGRFPYELKAASGIVVDNYDMIDHAAAVLVLLDEYRLTKDEKLREPIQKTMKYLLNGIEKNGEVSYLQDAQGKGYSARGNGHALTVLTMYTEIFEDYQYMKTCKELAQGILNLQDTQSGKISAEYQDGANSSNRYPEQKNAVAIVGLSKLYGLTHDENWLEAAKKASNYFVKEDITKNHEPLVSYAMNELTKYSTDIAYYELGLQNALTNITKMENVQSASAQYLGILMAAYEIGERANEKNILLKSISPEERIAITEAIEERAERNLNSYLWPEKAMYLSNPSKVEGTFVTPNTNYVIRLDNICANIAAYNMYARAANQIAAIQ